MKGLTEARESNAVYLGIKYAGLVQSGKEQKPGWQPITVVNPDTKEQLQRYFKRYDSVEGLVTKIELVTKEEGKYIDWVISLNANGVPVYLQIKYDSILSSQFMAKAPNFDFTQPLEISAWKGNQDRMAINFKQNDVKVEFAHSKDEPNGMPLATKNPVTSKWDFSKANEFLYNSMISVVIPRVEAAGNEMPEAQAIDNVTDLAAEGAINTVESDSPSGGDDDEIPF